MTNVRRTWVHSPSPDAYEGVHETYEETYGVESAGFYLMTIKDVEIMRFFLSLESIFVTTSIESIFYNFAQFISKKILKEDLRIADCLICKSLFVHGSYGKSEYHCGRVNCRASMSYRRDENSKIKRAYRNYNNRRKSLGHEPFSMEKYMEATYIPRTK